MFYNKCVEAAVVVVLPVAFEVEVNFGVGVEVAQPVAEQRPDWRAGELPGHGAEDWAVDVGAGESAGVGAEGDALGQGEQCG